MKRRRKTQFKEQSTLTPDMGNQANILTLSTKKGEADIRSIIVYWLRSNNIPVSLEFHTEVGPVDLHLENKRCIIEVKKRGRLNNGPEAIGSGSRKDESAFDQLKRYINAERKTIRLVGEEIGWMGVITDGVTWWIWEWPIQGSGNKPNPVIGWQRAKLSKNNLGDLERLLNRDGAGKPWIPDDPFYMFEPMIEQLSEKYNHVSTIRATKIQKKLWLDQLKGSGNHPKEPDQNSLFIKHSLLILISRLVSQSSDDDFNDDDLFDGFVGWTEETGKDVIDQLKDMISKYDWRPRGGDVMRQIYNNMIGSEQRRIYGEYYTPDWLAEKICKDVIDDTYIRKQLIIFKKNKKARLNGIIDPACGSGTFLYNAGKRLMNSKPVSDENLSDANKAKFVCAMINGIDIHPIATEMAIANMRRLLSGNIKNSDIRVYQGDSLLVERLQTKSLHDDEKNIVIYSEDNKVLAIPKKFLASRKYLDEFVESACNHKTMPTRFLKYVGSDDSGTLKTTYDNLYEIIQKKGNGVWAWYMWNQTSPIIAGDTLMGRIVSNAPWVDDNKISDKKRKKVIREAGKRNGIYVGGKLSTQFNIASVFTLICNNNFLEKNGRSGWVLPLPAMIGDGQWLQMREKLKEKHSNMYGHNYGNLPFPKHAHACVLYIGMTGKDADVKRKKDSKTIKPNDSWESFVKSNLEFIPRKTTRVVVSEWIEKKGKKSSIARNGATIFPIILICIEKITRSTGKNVEFETKRSRHGVWKTFEIKGNVPKSFIKNIAFASHLVPYSIVTYIPCIIPIDASGNWMESRKKNKFWKEVSDLYAGNCGKGNSTPKTLEAQLDYQGKLVSQFNTSGYMVVYNKSGGRLFAAVQHTNVKIANDLYRVPCKSENEAYFLAAILNADCMQAAFISTRKSDRDFHTYFWLNIGIPRFSTKNKTHKKLVKLAKNATKASKLFIESNIDDVNQTLLTPKKASRKQTVKRNKPSRCNVLKVLRDKGIAKEIDKATRIILPKYANDIGK